MVRLTIGVVLAAEVLRDWFLLGGQLSNYAAGLAVLFAALTAAYFIWHV
jgi:hypothetical protein